MGKGTAFVYWAGLPLSLQGSTWMGLSHAADWLPTFVSAIGSSVKDNETKPLDGVDIWQALLTNATSARSDIYYGISQGNNGPALRDVHGYKLILGGDGGGKGEWSLQQLPNASSLESDTTGSSPAPPTVGRLFYWLPGDVRERNPLDDSQYSKVIERLQSSIDAYDATKVPQLRGDPSCPSFAPIDSAKGKWIGPYCDDSSVVV